MSRPPQTTENFRFLPNFPRKPFIHRPSKLRFELIVQGEDLIPILSKQNAKESYSNNYPSELVKKRSENKKFGSLLKTRLVPKILKLYTKAGKNPLSLVQRKAKKKHSKIKKTKSSSKMKKHLIYSSKASFDLVYPRPSSSSICTPARSKNTCDSSDVPYQLCATSSLLSPQSTSFNLPLSPPPTPPSPAFTSAQSNPNSLLSLKRKREANNLEEDVKEDIVHLIEKRRRTQYAEIGNLKQPIRTKTLQSDSVYRHLQTTREQLVCKISSEITDLAVAAVGAKKKKAKTFLHKKEKLDRRIKQIISVQAPI
ncbi:hypothetical protein BKA69DRAFT_1084539 [Paraphysoderma sedebokerense]|nr:hypothetical protein BKA69DRAFT_1084539 [Paraphysoderma sedebokerense]